MPKGPAEIITTYGVETSGMTPEEVQALDEALDDPNSPEFKKMFLNQLRDAQESLLRGPDYRKLNAMLDEIDKRRVA